MKFYKLSKIIHFTFLESKMIYFISNPNFKSNLPDSLVVYIPSPIKLLNCIKEYS